MFKNIWAFGYYTIALNECKKISAWMEIYTGEGVKKMKTKNTIDVSVSESLRVHNKLVARANEIKHLLTQGDTNS